MIKTDHSWHLRCCIGYCLINSKILEILHCVANCYFGLLLFKAVEFILHSFLFRVVQFVLTHFYSSFLTMKKSNITVVISRRLENIIAVFLKICDSIVLIKVKSTSSLSARFPCTSHSVFWAHALLKALGYGLKSIYIEVLQKKLGFTLFANREICVSKPPSPECDTTAIFGKQTWILYEANILCEVNIWFLYFNLLICF
jgi:hypothetical protein